jgi:hypothetical protein
VLDAGGTPIVAMRRNRAGGCLLRFDYEYHCGPYMGWAAEVAVGYVDSHSGYPYTLDHRCDPDHEARFNATDATIMNSFEVLPAADHVV